MTSKQELRQEIARLEAANTELLKALIDAIQHPYVQPLPAAVTPSWPDWRRITRTA